MLLIHDLSKQKQNKIQVWELVTFSYKWFPNISWLMSHSNKLILGQFKALSYDGYFSECLTNYEFLMLCVKKDSICKWFEGKYPTYRADNVKYLPSQETLTVIYIRLKISFGKIMIKDIFNGYTGNYTQASFLSLIHI